jgi:hypothetical protein
VENEMQNGLGFNEAYHRVKQKIGGRGLREIQEETLYAIDTKYRFMKNTMKISGISGTVILGFASILKIQHWPFAGILMTLGALLLAFVFLPSSLSVLWKETHNKKRLFLFISAFFTGMFFISGTLFKIQHWSGAGIVLILAALSGILFFIPALLVSRLTETDNKAKRPIYILGSAGIICYTVGMLFKIQHWPLATFLMVLSVILLSVIVFPWYTWFKWKEESHIRTPYIFILIGFLTIVIPGALINLNLSRSYNYGYYSNLEQQKILYNYKYSNNLSFVNQYRDSSIYPEIEQLHSRTSQLLDLIWNIQTKMVAESEGKSGNPALKPDQVRQTDNGREIQYEYLSDPFSIDPVRDFLLPACNIRKDLNKALADYSDYIADLKAGEDIFKYRGILEPSVFLPENNQKGSEISLLSGLHSLELLKNSILTVESYVLESIVNK